MNTGSKILWLSLGVVVIGGVFIYSAHKAKQKKISRSKPKPQSVSMHQNGMAVSEPDWGSPFDMNYVQEVSKWLAPKQVRQLAPQEAARLAQRLYQAKGNGWYEDDDEDAVGEVFTKLVKDGVQIANISRKFYWLYKKDLWEYLNSFLSESEMEQHVSAPIRSLPTYRLT